MTAPFTWQPIASAPLDGTRILLTNGVGLQVAFWETTQYFVNGELKSATAEWSGWYVDIDPTHWAAIPSLPEVSDA